MAFSLLEGVCGITLKSRLFTRTSTERLIFAATLSMTGVQKDLVERDRPMAHRRHLFEHRI